MPIFASNFTSNSLSGAVFVSGGNVAVTLTPTPFALEGDKSFVIKIRRGSTQGTVLSTSAPITLKDRTEFISLTANSATVAEGNLVSFTVVTANVLDGATLFYSVLPVTSNVTSTDFVANTGSFVIASNSGTFALQANTDLSLMDESGETFKLQLRTNSVTGNIVYLASNIAILDTSKQYSYTTLTQSNVTLQGGGLSLALPITFNLTTRNAAGANLYYYMTGNAAGNIFTTRANADYFIVPANNFTTLNFTANLSFIGVNEDRTFQLIIAEAPGGLTKITGNTVLMTRLPPFAASATTGTLTTTDSGGYRRHKYTGSGTITFNQPGTVDYVVVAGGGNGGPAYTSGGGGGGGLLTGSITVTGGTPYTLTVGGGGGGPSSFPAVGTATVGGTPGGFSGAGGPGGSGGGGCIGNPQTAGGDGIPGQGYPGAPAAGGPGFAFGSRSGGGGGAGGAATSATGAPGISVPWSGSYSGGGGGLTRNPGTDGVGSPGGGFGAGDAGPISSPARNGTVNTGGGGGVCIYNFGNEVAGTGGSGIIDIRYAYSA
jgi:hypothetical protein